MFKNRKHAERAIAMMKKLLPKEHLLLASAQRVKALILEEIALDHMSDFSEDREFFILLFLSLKGAVFLFILN